MCDIWQGENFWGTLMYIIFAGLIVMLWQRETNISPQRNQTIIVDPAGSELTTSALRQHHKLPVFRHIHFMPLKLRKKVNPNDMQFPDWRQVNIHGAMPKINAYIYSNHIR